LQFRYPRIPSPVAERQVYFYFCPSDKDVDMRPRVVTHRSFQAAGLREAWSALSETAASPSLFTTFEWCRCWADTIGQNTLPLILEIQDGACTIGLAPFCVDLRGPARWLRFMGRDRASGDHLDLLCLPGREQDCLTAVLEHLAQPDAGFDGLLLGELDTDSPTLDAFTSWARRKGFTCRRREHRRVPYLALPATFEAVVAGLSSNMRYHIRRRRRGLSLLPGALIDTCGDADNLNPILDAFFELHRTRWLRERQPGNFADPVMQNFLREFCQAASRKEWLRLHVLRADNQIQGVLVAFHYRNVACYYQMGWNPDGSVESPGVVLLAHSIEQAVREGLSRYDLLRGEEAYKTRWTPTATEQVTLVIGTRLTSRLALSADALKDMLKYAIRGCLGAAAWNRVRHLATGRSL
jgi:CelD/BcsL family acetyltransferase involved in cellulose biosynthesis